MNVLEFLSSAVLLSLASSALAQTEVWPRAILRGDYPDPSVLRDGEDYYMTHSPFVYSPGFLIWQSKTPCIGNWLRARCTTTNSKDSSLCVPA